MEGRRVGVRGGTEKRIDGRIVCMEMRRCVGEDQGLTVSLERVNK